MSKTEKAASISLKVRTRLVEEMADLYGGVNRHGVKTDSVERAMESYLELRKFFLFSLKGVFSEGELKALVDNQNGTLLTKKLQTKVDLYWYALEDGNKYEGVFSKWDVNGEEFKKKVFSLSPGQVFFLQEEIDRFWHGNDDQGLKDLNQFAENFK